jgi:hypothetical protein
MIFQIIFDYDFFKLKLDMILFWVTDSYIINRFIWSFLIF